jgi:hypothetical protein
MQSRIGKERRWKRSEEYGADVDEQRPGGGNRAIARQVAGGTAGLCTAPEGMTLEHKQAARPNARVKGFA